MKFPHCVMEIVNAKELDSVGGSCLCHLWVTELFLALSRHLERLFLTGTSVLILEPSGNTDIDGSVFSTVI